MQDISIVEAKTPEQVAQIAALLRGLFAVDAPALFQVWPEARRLFDKRQWESELADLPGHYGAPFGGMVLAYVDGVPAGCVLMRGIGSDVAEMKRLFVRPAFQGLGLGRQMAEERIVIACERGYPRMQLETGALQTEAQGLYRTMGFEPIAPYYACPEWLARHGHFYETKTCARAPIACGGVNAPLALPTSGRERGDRVLRDELFFFRERAQAQPGCMFEASCLSPVSFTRSSLTALAHRVEAHPDCCHRTQVARDVEINLVARIDRAQFDGLAGCDDQQH